MIRESVLARAVTVGFRESFCVKLYVEFLSMDEPDGLVRRNDMILKFDFAAPYVADLDRAPAPRRLPVHVRRPRREQRPDRPLLGLQTGDAGVPGRDALGGNRRLADHLLVAPERYGQGGFNTDRSAVLQTLN
ncbi:hypothetical protein AAE478_002114 [Parahypoxylon ruwenzoriense]